MKDPEEIRSAEAVARLARLASEALERVASSVIPVLLPSAKGRRKFLGSAVLLRVGPSEFLVTAAHVMDDARASFQVGVGDSVIPIAAPFMDTKAPNGNRRADRLDLCVVRLRSEHVHELRACHFLSLSEMEPGEVPDLRPIVGGKYLLVGYPSNKAKLKHSGVLEYDHLRFTANAREPEAYRRGGWLPETHLLIEYDTKTSWNTAGKTTPPDPGGVSGGAIFRARGWLDGAAASEKLVAIPIRYSGKQGKSIVGTRIGYVLGHIAHEHPELAPYIRKQFP